MGRSGIGVALSRGAAPAVAHVLPLNGSGSRQGLLPRAAAAVFVSAPAKMDPAGELPIGVARSLELTAAEARLVGQLMAGATLAQAAAALGIAATTAKSQLHSAFRKAGVSRQADLLALLERLDPRVRTPDGGAGPPSS
jgi:DNA-binding CsgD family transcriptional regulator